MSQAALLTSPLTVILLQPQALALQTSRPAPTCPAAGSLSPRALSSLMACGALAFPGPLGCSPSGRTRSLWFMAST